MARTVTAAAAIVLSLAILAMLTDYVVARLRAPQDAAAVLVLQRQVEADRGAAGALAAEQDRITRSRQARMRRDVLLAIVAIAAASMFVGASKWSVAMAGRRPVVSAKSLTHGEPQCPGPVGQGFGPDRTAHPGPVGEGLSPGIDLSFIDRAIAMHGRSKEAAIPLLQAIQAHYRYLPDEALRRVCELTEVTPAQIAGTSSFYAHFRRSPLGDHVVRVCHGTACHVSGARQITEELRRRLRIPEGADTDPERRFTIDEVACLGCCSLAPVLMVDEQTAGRLTPATAVAALDLAHEPEPA
jgi:NADH:ubiquinone oxidoreductase subunit E